MAFEAARAIVKFVADPSALGGAVSSVNGILDKFKQRAEAAARAARRILLVGAGVAAGVIALAAVQAKAEARLEAVIRATGQAAGFTADQLKKQAAALQEITAVGDETIIKSQAILATFKQIKGDVFQDAIMAALDMSAVMGTDLQGSIVQVGKALNDPILGLTALSRVGVSFNDQQKAQIRLLQEAGDVMGAQRIILAELKGEFGGAAEVIGKTFAGQLSKLKNDLGDLGEEIGFALVPPLLAFLERIRPLIPLIIDWVRVNAILIISVAAVGTAVLGLIAIIPSLVAAFQLILLNPVGLILTALVATVLALGQAFRDTGQEGNIFTDILKAVANQLGLVSDELRALLDPKTPFKKAAEDFDEFKKKLAEQFPEQARPFGGLRVEDILGLEDLTSGDKLKILVEFQERLENLVKETKRLEERTGSAVFARSFLGGQQGIRNLRKLRKTLTSEIKALNDEIAEDQRKAGERSLQMAKNEAQTRKDIDLIKKLAAEGEKQRLQEIARLRQEEIDKLRDKGKLLKDIELIGVDAAERERILAARRRKDILERAKAAGLSDEQVEDLKFRLFVEDIKGAKQDRPEKRVRPPQFVGLEALFKRIQGARDPQEKMLAEQKQIRIVNEKQLVILRNIAKTNQNLAIKLAEAFGISAGDVLNVFGLPVN